MGPFKSKHEKMKCTLIPFISKGFRFCLIFFMVMISLWVFMFCINKEMSYKPLTNLVLMGFKAYFYKKKGHDRAVNFHVYIYWDLYENH